MSNSPLLSRPIPGPPEPHVFLPLETVHTTFTGASSEGEEIVDILRSAIATGASSLDPILTSIAEAAQSLTGATAAALALRRNSVVVCRARSGDAAPELGTELSQSSGISGECLRTGKTLRCDDTQKDYRVNAEVCRRLNLHSIAIVPLRARLEIAGVLEVFSTRAYAFGEAQMTVLGRLAELAEAAYSQELSAQAKAQAKPTAAPPKLIPGSEPWTHPNEAALRRLGSQVTTEDLRERGKGSYRIGIAAALLIAVALVTWRAASKPRHEAAPIATTAPVPAAPVEESAEISLMPMTTRPAPARTPDSGATVTAVRKPRAEAETEPEISDVVTRELNSADGAPATAIAKPAENNGTLVSSSLREPEAAAPRIETASANGSTLGNFLVSPAAIPKFSPPVSEGVSGGVLEHRVQPAYPSQAKALGLEGPVMLEATIDPAGKVGKVKVLKGHPVLAQAAMDAVRQWRYRPYELNGKPVEAQAQIVVNFRAPTH